MGIVVIPVWLFSLFTVLGSFSIAILVGIFLSYKYGDKIYSSIMLPFSMLFSWYLVSYSLAMLVERVSDKKVNGLFAFTEMVWGSEMFYIAIASFIFIGAAFRAKKYSSKLFSCFMSLALIFLFAGSVQAYIGLFKATSFFEQHNIAVKNSY